MHNSIKQPQYTKWFVMASVGVGLFMSPLDGAIVNYALPRIQEDFQASFAVIQWIPLAYSLTLVTLMLTIGRLGDMFGKKRIYTAGYFLFTLASALCGFSTSIGMLIAARIFQAMGSVLMMALGAAILTETFPSNQRGMVLGISGLMVSLGSISGPSLGGLILQYLDWHWIFFINLPIGVFGTLLSWRFVPDIRPIGKQRFDYAGAACLFLSLLSLLLSLTFGQDYGYTHPLILAGFITFVVFLVIFIYLENHVREPMMDLSMFRNRLFSVNLITGFLLFVCASGVFLLMPFYLEYVMKVDAGIGGLLMGISPLMMGLFAPLSGTLSDRLGTRPLTVVGLLSILCGYVLASTTLGETTTILAYAMCIAPMGMGMGLFQSPNNSAIMGSAPRERLGVASGLMSITRTMGNTVGIALMGSFWASRVFAYTPGGVAAAQQAPITSQVAALHDTFLINIFLISLALLLALWALIKERQAKLAAARVKVAPPTVNPQSGGKE
ncbi:MAG TPA: MFS transporter [Anaerolineaceae bacterium]